MRKRSLDFVKHAYKTTTSALSSYPPPQYGTLSETEKAKYRLMAQKYRRSFLSEYLPVILASAVQNGEPVSKAYQRWNQTDNRFRHLLVFEAIGDLYSRTDFSVKEFIKHRSGYHFFVGDPIRKLSESRPAKAFNVGQRWAGLDPSVRDMYNAASDGIRNIPADISQRVTNSYLQEQLPADGSAVLRFADTRIMFLKTLFPTLQQHVSPAEIILADWLLQPDDVHSCFRQSAANALSTLKLKPPIMLTALRPEQRVLNAFLARIFGFVTFHNTHAGRVATLLSLDSKQVTCLLLFRWILAPEEVTQTYYLKDKLGALRSVLSICRVPWIETALKQSLEREKTAPTEEFLRNVRAGVDQIGTLLKGLELPSNKTIQNAEISISIIDACHHIAFSHAYLFAPSEFYKPSPAISPSDNSTSDSPTSSIFMLLTKFQHDTQAQEYAKRNVKKVEMVWHEVWQVLSDRDFVKTTDWFLRRGLGVRQRRGRSLEETDSDDLFENDANEIEKDKLQQKDRTRVPSSLRTIPSKIPLFSHLSAYSLYAHQSRLPVSQAAQQWRGTDVSEAEKKRLAEAAIYLNSIGFDEKGMQ